MKTTLEELQAFAAVVGTGSITAAADQLGQTVSGVSRALGRLEKKKMIASYVGIPSPHRGGRRRKHFLIDTEGQKALGRAWRAFTAMADGMEIELAAL